mgnify:FL=1
MTMRSITRAITIAIISAAGVVSLSVPTSAQSDDYAARRDTIRAFFMHPDVGENYASATARILSEDHRADGIAMFDRLSQGTSPEIMERFRMTAAWVHARRFLPDTLNERIRYIWEQFPVRPFYGEHERVAYFSVLYLAVRLFPEDAAYFNGRSREANEQDARGFLLHWMREVTEKGQREFDSPTYAAVCVTSMLLLRDFIPDDDMRSRAELMAQWLLADFAHDHLNGNYVGAHGRENLLSAMQPISSEMSSISWLYFGDGPRLYSREQLLAALSDFRPHPAVVELATSRRDTFVSWERKRTEVRVRDNGLTPDDEDIIRYTYMHPLFAMGSIPGGLVQSREQHSWDVTWISYDPDRPATLFFMQPYADPDALTPFLPHSEELAFRNIGSLDPYWGALTKTVGGSPYEDVFQHRNTLIALYDIGDVTRFPVLTGFLPPKVDTMIVDSLDSGWITINAGDVYIGVYPFREYRISDGMFGRRFISRDRRNGVIVHAAGRSDAGAFEDFQRRIRSTRPALTAFDSDARITYTTIDGDVLDFTFGGKRTVNGTTPRMPADMLFSSRWLTSRTGSGILTIHASSGDVHIDMNTLEIRSGD